MSFEEHLAYSEMSRQDEDLARSSMMSRLSGKSFNEDGMLIANEPERDYDTVRAKIKLRIMKKFQEDEKRKMQAIQEIEKARAEVIARGEDPDLLPPQNVRKRKKHAPITRRRSFTEC